MKISDTVIRSRQNPLVKWAASLQDKKGREQARSFIAEGEKLTFEAAGSSLPVTHIFVTEEKKEKLIGKLEGAFQSPQYKNTVLTVLSEEAFSKISTEKSPQGVISVIKYLDFFEELDIIYNVDFCFSEDERMMALSSLRDPSNLGAVIRSAVAFGVQRIVLSSDCASPYNPKTIRSAMGSLFRVKLTIVKDFCSFIRFAKEQGRRVFAAELNPDALALGEFPLCGTDIIVIGNEGHGISPLVSGECTDSIYIPISENTESLNAAVAAAVFMWEISK